MADDKFQADFSNFYIPNYILSPSSQSKNLKTNEDQPNCPVLVFVNSKSGGQLGGDLLKTYRYLLNKNQVSLEMEVYYCNFKGD